MKINWKVRFKHKSFWLTLIPALGVLAQAVIYPFVPDIDFTGINAYLVGIVNVIFAVLAILGIVSDTTTQGISDTPETMKTKTPAMNKKQLDKGGKK